MDTDVELISDGDGIAIIGHASAVERFVAERALPSVELRLERLTPSLGTSGAVLQAGSEVAANAGRWVKLTKESAEKIQAGHLMAGPHSEAVRGIVRGDNGHIQHIVQFTRGGLTNPALLAGVGGIMAQLAMEQQMKEISDYLAVIDEKVDDVLRAQKDAALAEMLGVDFVIDEAMTLRQHVGRVSEVTWSKAQGAAMVIGRTQAYALSQLDALAEKLEGKTDIDEQAKAAKQADSTAQEWLAVLAHCVRLQEALAVLELDRVLDSSPEELEQHRAALRAVRQNRVQLIARSTALLIERMAAASQRANTKVLFNPINSPAIVRANNAVNARVGVFRDLLGIDDEQSPVEARRWTRAVADLRDAAVDTGAGSVSFGKRLGLGGLDRARSMTNKLALGVADHTRRAD